MAIFQTPDYYDVYVLEDGSPDGFAVLGSAKEERTTTDIRKSWESGMILEAMAVERRWALATCVKRALAEAQKSDVVESHQGASLEDSFDVNSIVHIANSVLASQFRTRPTNEVPHNHFLEETIQAQSAIIFPGQLATNGTRNTEVPE
jgi:hypothetical protein